MTSFPEGTHVRVHPLLHWTEVDIWKYTKRENIPVIDLYFSRNGKRYRSLGDQDITSPISSKPRPWTRSSPSLRRRRCPSAPAAPWTTRPRMRSSGCGRRGICRAARPARPEPDQETVAPTSRLRQSLRRARPWRAGSAPSVTSTLGYDLPFQGRPPTGMIFVCLRPRRRLRFVFRAAAGRSATGPSRCQFSPSAT